MNQQRWQVFVSIVAGLAVSFCALVVASRNGGDWLQIPENGCLWMDSNHLEEAISDFRQSHKRLPDDLAQLDLRANMEVAKDMQFDKAGCPLDPWGVPYAYHAEGHCYEIVTLAADGKPGGIGGNADARVAPMGENEIPNLDPPTLWQYIFEYATASAIATCVAAGVCTFLVGLLRTGRTARSPVKPNSFGYSVLSFWLSVIVVGALSAYMAGLLAMYHLPFEHH